MHDLIVAGALSMALFSNASQPSTTFNPHDPCLRMSSVQCGPARPVPKTDHRFRGEAIATLSKHLDEQFVVELLNHKDACSWHVLPEQEEIKLAELRRRMMLEESFIRGEEFLQQHSDALKRLTNRDAFLPFYVLAVLRIETDFGRNFGTTPALRTFYEAYAKRRRSKGATAANRSFVTQAVPLLQYAQTLGIDPCTIYGSSSGAIGFPQFMPFSLDLARDGDNDGVVDILRSPRDAMASIVSFFQDRRWGKRPRGEVLRRYCGTGRYAERYAAIAEEYALALKKRVEKRYP